MQRIVHLFVIAVMFVSATLAPHSTIAQDTDTGVNEEQYVDQDERFSVPIPTNWTVEESDEFITLVDPDGEFRIHAVVVDSGDATQAIADAWLIVDPTFNVEATPLDSQEIPPPPGIDQFVVITFDIGQTSGQIAQGAAQRVGQVVYVLIFVGSLDAATKRDSQIQIVASGFKISSVETSVLTDIKPVALEGDLLEEFATYIEDLLVLLEVPGASVAVIQNGEIVFIQGFGVKQLGEDDPITPSTRMMIGSTTKSMTTLMMATVVDDGLMGWDTPVQEILPQFEVADGDLSSTITMRNLVCACTGVPRRDLELIFNASELSAEDVIESLAEFEFFTGFGEAFQYSNQMVAAGGYATAAAAGGEWGNLYRAYVDEIEGRVFEPIGMDDTTLSFEEVSTSNNFASPHGANLGAEYETLPLSAEQVLLPVAPAGTVWSTAEDMAAYLITQMSGGVTPGGDRIVSEENLQETWQPQVAVDAETDYGLGWLVQDYKGLQVIHHGGNTMGFTSDLAFLPDAGVGIVVLANGQASNLFNEGVRYRLLELLYDQPAESEEEIRFALEQGEATYAGLRSLIEVIAFDDSFPLLGTYENDVLGQIVISSTGDAIYLDAGEFRSELRAYTDPNDPDQPMLIAWDPPLAGTPLEVSIDEDNYPVIAFDLTTDVYEFTRVAETGLSSERWSETPDD